MEKMKTQVELLKECCDIKDAACVKYQKRIAELEEEIENHKQNIMQDELEIIPKLEEENKKLKEENEKLKEAIKDHQLYEEKLEHRIIEFEELLP